MPNSQSNIIYLGKDVFTRKIVQALFEKKGLKVRPSSQMQSTGEQYQADIIFLDHEDQISVGIAANQILLSAEPVANPSLKYWCKTPVSEGHVDNILFYQNKSESLVTELPPNFSFCLKRVRNFLDNDEAEIREIVAEFIDNLSTNYRNLESALLATDHPSIQHYAHKMLAGAKFYEIERLALLLRQLETGSEDYQQDLNEMCQLIYQQVIALRSALIGQLF